MARVIGLIMSRRFAGWWVVLIALSGLALTAAVVATVIADQETSRKRLFETMGSDIAHRLGPFLLVDHALRGTRGMVQATGGLDVLTSDQFNVYARSRDVGHEFPGTRGIGLAVRVPAGQDARAAALLQSRGWPLDGLWSLGPNASDRYIVVGVYPTETNFEAVGGDLASEPRRAAAIIEAIRTGQAQISAPIRLIRSVNRVEPGFLIVLPIYRGVTVPQSEGDRLRTGTGVVVMPVAIRERMELFQWPRDQIELAIEDVTNPATPLLLYASHQAKTSGGFAQSIALKALDRNWRVTLRARPAFDNNLKHTPVWLIAAFGVLISLATAAGAWLVARTIKRIAGLNAKLHAQAQHRQVELEDARANALASSRQLVRMIEENPQGIALVTLPPFEVVETNPRFRQLVPNLGKLEGLLAPMLGSPEAIAHPSPELTVVCDEGRWLRFTCSRMNDEQEGDKRYILMAEDVTAAHEQRLMLDEAFARLYLASEAAQIGVWYWNFGDDTVQWDQKMFDIFGRTTEERESISPSYQFWVDCVHPDDVEMAELSLNEARAKGADWACNYRVICANGEIRTIEAFAMHRRDQAGQSIGLLGVCRDATERLRLEAELIDANRAAEAANKAKDQFLANISHELRTPMNAVLGLLQILERGELDNAQRLHVTGAKRAANALLRILNDILDFSRLESGVLDLITEPVSLRRLADATLALYDEAAKSKGVHLSARVNGGAQRKYWGDELRLGQIINNLVDNAIKFTNAGEVEIVISSEAVGDQRDLVRFEVRDTGQGLGTVDAERLFQPFVQAEPSITRSHGGSGLGLAICRQMVQAMGGTIGAEPNAAKGALFWFEIPLDHGADARLQQVRQLEPGRALILSSQEDYGRLLLGQLNSLGLTSDLIADPADLTPRLAEAGEQGQAFDLLLVDFETPFGDMPLMIAELQRAELLPTFSRTSLIMLSRSDADPQTTAHRAMLLMPDAALVKPVSALRLYEVISDLQRKGFTDRPAARPPFDKDQFAGILRSFADARILLVEDNRTNQEVALALLEQFGLGAEVVSNGQEAVERLASQDYAIALMDIHMPVLNGLEAARAIRSGGRNSGIPIIAMTAAAFSEDRRKAFEAGMSDFISKPIDVDRLAALLVKWLPRSGADRLESSGLQASKALVDER